MNHPTDRLRDFEVKHGTWHDNLIAYSSAICKDRQSDEDKKTAKVSWANMRSFDLLIAEWQGWDRGYKAAKLEVTSGS